MKTKAKHRALHVPQPNANKQKLSVVPKMRYAQHK